MRQWRKEKVTIVQRKRKRRLISLKKKLRRFEVPQLDNRDSKVGEIGLDDQIEVQI